MANVLMRRTLNRNLLKLKDLIHFSSHTRCASINIKFQQNNLKLPQIKNFEHVTTFQIQCYSKECKDYKNEKEKKLTVFQRFKQMYKNYWYVLVPVHLVTSAAWFGGFYYLAKSGVDIVAILESMHMSEKIINPLKDSSMGYLAVAYALYKIATPARYTITLGGTTISINYLRKWGYIKPVPSAEKLKEIYHEQKDNLIETMKGTKEGLKDKKDDIMQDLDKSIKQIKELGDKMKSSKEHAVDGVKKKNKKG